MSSTNRSAADIYSAQDARKREKAEADRQIREAFSGAPAKGTPAATAAQQVHESFTGRGLSADQSDANKQVHDAFNGSTSAEQAERALNDTVSRAWNGIKDPAADAEDAKLIHGNPLWMEQSEVNMAVESYRDARLARLPHTETMASAKREADAERDRYIESHRHEHATQAALLEATATHLTGLAAALRPRPDQKVNLPESRRNTQTVTPKTLSEAPTVLRSTPAKTTRIRDERGGGIIRH